MPSERDKIYSIWTSLKARCANANDKDYARYGGRGIKVCQRWADSFDDFQKDMGSRKSGETVERLNNDGNYEPANCKWATRAAQSRNRNHGQLDLFAKTHEFDAEIFSVGKWNNDTYSEKDLEDIVNNFNALSDVVKPPVKLGHAWKEGQPALGWVKALKKVGSKIVATLSEVPQVVYEAITAGRYKRVSSELFMNFKSKKGKTFNYVLKAVALLGADIPAVDNLDDLTAFLSQQFQEGTFDKVAAYDFEYEGGAGKTNYFTIHTKPDKGDLKMSAEETKKIEDRIAKLEGSLATEKTRADTAEAANIKQAEAQKKADFALQVKAFKDECDALVKDGKMLPAERDKFFTGVDQKNFSDGEYNVPFAVLKEFVSTRKILDTDEHGRVKDNKKEYTSASEELADRAKTYSLKNGVSYEEGSTAILAEDAELAQKYKDE